MDIAGKLVVVTGANTGIGRSAAEVLAKRGAHVILACRSEEKTKPVVDAITAAGGKAEFLALDLGDLASVRAAAKTLLDRGDALPILINNAGVGGPQGTTKDGFELAFGTNHLGHYLFTRLVMPLVEKGATEAEPSRIVHVSSKSHYRAKGIDWGAIRKPTASVTGLPEYEVSKLANVLFSNELARRGPKTIRSYSLHPGVVASDAWRRIPWGFRHLMKAFMITNEDGAKTTVYCATSDDVKDHNGRYYDKCKERTPSKLAQDESLARELWTKSAEWVGLPA